MLYSMQHVDIRSWVVKGSYTNESGLFDQGISGSYWWNTKSGSKDQLQLVIFGRESTDVTMSHDSQPSPSTCGRLTCIGIITSTKSRRYTSSEKPYYMQEFPIGEYTRTLKRYYILCARCICWSEEMNRVKCSQSSIRHCFRAHLNVLVWRHSSSVSILTGFYTISHSFHPIRCINWSLFASRFLSLAEIGLFSCCKHEWRRQTENGRAREANAWFHYYLNVWSARARAWKQLPNSQCVHACIMWMISMTMAVAPDKTKQEMAKIPLRYVFLFSLASLLFGFCQFFFSSFFYFTSRA